MLIQKHFNQLGFPYRFSKEIALRRKVQEKFNGICESFNSSEIEVPLIEPLNCIIGHPPKPLRESHLNMVFHGLVFFENMSLTSAVRYEASGSIAKIAAMQNSHENLLFHYMQEMVRLENSEELSSTRHRAFFQMGHERFTRDQETNIKNIAHEIEMMIRLFHELKLKGRVRISHVQMVRCGLQSGEINSALRNRLIPLFEKASKEEAFEVLSKIPLTQNLHEFLRNVLECRNVPLNEGIKLMKSVPELSQAVQELNALIQAMSELGISEENIVFDAGIYRSLGFYSGLVFQADAEGIQEVAGGGDFSLVIKNAEEPNSLKCSGFAIGYERIAAALQQKYCELEFGEMNYLKELLQTA
jgi:histidyl-tRNA synthetase